MGITTKLSSVADAVPFPSGCRPVRLACAVLLAAVLIVASAGVAPANESIGAVGPADDPVVAAAGDIAGAWDEDEATAALLDAIDPTLVFALGDLAYYDGTDAEFNAFYDPTWGRHKDKTRPIVGNHEYHTPGAAGYFNYFGTAAGDPAKGYYAFDVGSWRVYALNTNCGEVGCEAGSEQEQWLRGDLAANPRRCTLAMGHSPRFSSHADAGRRDNMGVAPLYQAFYAAAGDVWLAGHNHFYERLTRLDPTGAADPARGIRNFVVGTGGAGLYDFGLPRAGSEVRESGTHGVIELVLHATGYEWEFVPVAGETFTDSGAEPCDPDNEAPSPPTDVEAVASGSSRIDLRWTPATDDVAVTGYDVFRDGFLLATTGAVTGYSDTAAAPATTYEYYVVARDGSGNASAPSAAATATTEPLLTRRTLAAAADARVEQANPAANYGGLALRTDSGTDAAVESHLRFSLTGLNGTVTSAKLRVYATTPSVDGPAVYSARTEWDEMSVTWDNRPARDTEALDDAGAVPDETWIELDVSAAVTGDGTYDFALAQPGGDGVDIRSRESQLAPQLVVETGG